MTTTTIEFLGPPQVLRRYQLEGQQERRISNWITTWDLKEEIDVGVVGIPLAKGTHMPAGVDTTPNAIRKAMVYYTTYNPDLGVDIQSLRVRHVGDVRLHATDLLENHRRIETALTGVFGLLGKKVTILLGGDGSITTHGVKALAKATKEKLGIIQFDARVDSRDVAEGGPSDLTPTRAILEANIGIAGRNMAHIGAHGFLSAMAEQSWAQGHGVAMASVRQVRKEGIEAVVKRVLTATGRGTAGIYVSVDGTALDITSSGSALMSAPGGLSLSEMQEALYLIGQNPKVRVLELVGIDTFNDLKDVVARTSLSMALSFLAGVQGRG